MIQDKKTEKTAWGKLQQHHQPSQPYCTEWGWLFLYERWAATSLPQLYQEKGQTMQPKKPLVVVWWASACVSEFEDRSIAIYFKTHAETHTCQH